MKKTPLFLLLAVSLTGPVLADTLNVMAKTVSRSPDGFATGWAIHSYDPVRCPVKDDKPASAPLPVRISAPEKSTETAPAPEVKLIVPSVCYNRSMDKVEAQCTARTWRLSGIVFYDTLSTAEGKVLSDPQWFINVPFLEPATDEDKIIVHGLCD